MFLRLQMENVFRWKVINYVRFCFCFSMQMDKKELKKVKRAQAPLLNSGITQTVSLGNAQTRFSIQNLW